MKKSLFTIAVFTTMFILVMTTSNCKKENKESLFCDSTNVSFKNTIKPILDNSCLSCHSNANAVSLGGGTVLSTYNDVINYVDTTTGSDLGTLYQDVLTGDMPKGQSKLSDCEIGKIKNWILEGAKDN